MHYGTVIEYSPTKGYGFIRPDFGQDVFFHYTSLGACRQRPQIEPGQMVKYELVPGTEPNTQARPRPSNDSSARPEQPLQPKAMLVELIDQMPAEAALETAAKRPSTPRHPRARRRKPTWRR